MRVFLDPHVRFRQRLDDLVQLLRRQRQRPAFGDRRRALAAQPHFEIRREQLHFVAVGLDQDVRENRDRVLSFDDALEELQFSQQVSLPDDKLHVLVTSKDALRRGVLLIS